MNTLSLKNETFLVGTLFNCDTIDVDATRFQHNTMFRQTLIGCKILDLLRGVFKFNVTYCLQPEGNDLIDEIKNYSNSSVAMDIYARPMSLRGDVIPLAFPIHSIFDWNFGFIINRPEDLDNYKMFYSKPFTRPLWNCLYAMAFFCSVLFYLLKRWERKILKTKKLEVSFVYEALVVIGAYSQHIPPLDAVLYSRRTAYLVFLLFAYLIYTYYTSNLLSHLVNDKDCGMSLDILLKTDTECVIVDEIKQIFNNNIASIFNHNISSQYRKLLHLRPVSIVEGLEAVRNGGTALLSDYITLDPFMNSVFQNHEICNLIKIDVLNSLEKYIFVSRTFQYKEEFKTVAIRASETGIMSRLTHAYNHTQTHCQPQSHLETQLHQIFTPLVFLGCAYALSIIILLIEIIHFKRNKLWPYTE